MARRKVLVPYVVTGELVEVTLPGWVERHVWWPLARRMSERTRRRLWALAWPNRRWRWPWEHAAQWLITHTPWWGGPGIARPDLHKHVVKVAR